VIYEVASHVRACRVGSRCFVLLLEEVMQERTFGERNQIYSQEAVRLGLEAADGALRAAHVTAEEIDALVFVSCTGYMLPGPDAYIANQLGCKPTVSRTPIQQLGCAAGATALAKAHDYLVSRPEATALVTAVELSSLSYQASKRSMSDFISNARFGDARQQSWSSRTPPGNCQPHQDLRSRRRCNTCSRVPRA
jgi:1,3,6,8-tetrahydroxynaphthalene synthase